MRLSGVIPIAYQDHYYGRDGESLQGLAIDKIERIRNQVRRKDWSAEIIENATLEDLDPTAIAKARELYTKAHKDRTEEIESWDDITFLNKAKITVRGKITNTAIVLLGKEESEYLISPAVANRNQFLATAMVGLKMVDTIGSGIRKMYHYQRQRLFPLPNYDLSENHVEVTIMGKILDMNYANILANNTDLDLLDIELLNRIQLGKKLSDIEISSLRKKHLIEGRKPNIYIAKHIAQKVGQKIEYSGHKGLGNKRCEQFLLTALQDHQSLSRKEIDKLLWPLLPDLLNDKQKKDKITNMLIKLRKLKKISNISKGPNSEWFIN